MSSTDTQCLALPMGATCYWKDMWQQLNSMRSHFQLCDVILSTIDDGMYGAHSPVLAASSNVFYEYFLGKVNCSSVITQVEGEKNIKLLVNGINRQVLHVVLDFIYGVTPATIIEFEKLKVGAELLKIHSAYNYCGAKFYQNVVPRPDNYMTYEDSLTNNGTVVQMTDNPPGPPSVCPMSRPKKVCPVTYTSGDSCPISDIFNRAIDNGVQISEPMAQDQPSPAVSIVTPPNEPPTGRDGDATNGATCPRSIASITFDEMETPMECPHLKKKTAGNNWTNKLEAMSQEVGVTSVIVTRQNCLDVYATSDTLSSSSSPDSSHCRGPPPSSLMAAPSSCYVTPVSEQRHYDHRYAPSNSNSIGGALTTSFTTAALPVSSFPLHSVPPSSNSSPASSFPSNTFSPVNPSFGSSVGNDPSSLYASYPCYDPLQKLPSAPSVSSSCSSTSYPGLLTTASRPTAQAQPSSRSAALAACTPSSQLYPAVAKAIAGQAGAVVALQRTQSDGRASQTTGKSRVVSKPPLATAATTNDSQPPPLISPGSAFPRFHGNQCDDDDDNRSVTEEGKNGGDFNEAASASRCPYKDMTSSPLAGHEDPLLPHLSQPQPQQASTITTQTLTDKLTNRYENSPFSLKSLQLPQVLI